MYGDVGDNFVPNFVPNYGMINALTTLQNALEQYKYVSTNKIHGYAHMVFSGMWGGTIDETTRVASTAFVNANKTILDSFRQTSGALVLFAWLDGIYSRDSGKCSISL